MQVNKIEVNKIELW